MSQSLKVVVNVAAQQCIAPRATECNVGPQEIELKGTKPTLFPADMKGKASRLFPHVDSLVVDREIGEFTYFVAYDDISVRLTRQVKDGVCSTGR